MVSVLQGLSSPVGPPEAGLDQTREGEKGEEVKEVKWQQRSDMMVLTGVCCSCLMWWFRCPRAGVWVVWVGERKGVTDSNNGYQCEFQNKSCFVSVAEFVLCSGGLPCIHTAQVFF